MQAMKQHPFHSYTYGVVTKAARQLNHSIQGAMMCRMYVKLRSFSLFEIKQITEACDLLSARFFYLRQRITCGMVQHAKDFSAAAGSAKDLSAAT